MGAPTTLPIAPGIPGAVGSLDSGAWTEPPMGMEPFIGPKGGLIRFRGLWRLVIGSPSWASFYGLAEMPGWDAPGQEWNTAATPVPPAMAPIQDLASSIMTSDPAAWDSDEDVTMANTTTTTFAVTPGGVDSSAATGDFASQGASVQLETQASVTTRAKWEWLPWVALAVVVWLASKARRGE